MQNKQATKIADSVIEKLTEARKAQGLSHEKVAELAGLNRSTISLIESRKREPTLVTCMKIAGALGISLGEQLVKAEKNKDRL